MWFGGPLLRALADFDIAICHVLLQFMLVTDAMTILTGIVWLYFEGKTG